MPEIYIYNPEPEGKTKQSDTLNFIILQQLYTVVKGENNVSDDILYFFENDPNVKNNIKDGYLYKKITRLGDTSIELFEFDEANREFEIVFKPVEGAINYQINFEIQNDPVRTDETSVTIPLENFTGKYKVSVIARSNNPQLADSEPVESEELQVGDPVVPEPDPIMLNPPIIKSVSLRED